jgi:hypothetical protein
MRLLRHRRTGIQAKEKNEKDQVGIPLHDTRIRDTK